MNSPKVKSVTALERHTLLGTFDNQQVRQYDVTPLLNKAMFEPLKSVAFFNAVRIEQGGYAVVWDENIDISEYELWRHGQAVDIVSMC